MGENKTDRVIVERDVVFGAGGARDLRCNVYTPPAAVANGVGLLMIHGGSWINGDRNQLNGYGILLGRIGYTCVLPEYRLAGEAKWPAQLHDVKAGLRWMRANAGSLGFDGSKIAVTGNSAGAHLSLMVAGTQGMAEFEGDGGNTGVATSVNACVAFYAPVRLAREGDALREPVRMLLGRDAGPEHAIAASPITYVSSAFPPTQLITGNRDMIVPDESSFAMYRALVDVGAKAELHVYEGAPHAFDAFPEFGRQTAAIMALFIDRHVTNPRGFQLPATATA